MPSDSQTVPLSQLADGDPHLALLIVHRGKVRQIPLGDNVEVVIGRGSDASVQVPDRGLSRRHVCVRAEGTAVTVTDLGSSNGTFLRGVRIDANVPQRLPFDVPVSVGETKLVVHGADESKRIGLYATAVETTRRMAASLLNVLFVGERAVGKRYLATALHRASPRAAAALVQVNLRSSELDPRTVRPGQTLLLLELDALRPIEQDRLAGRLGATRNVRLLGALRAKSADALQPSLRRVLGEVEIVIPSLHELGEELGTIAQAMASEAAARMQLARTPQFDDAALARLSAHPYRDGFRELRGIVDRVVAHCDADVIGESSLLFEHDDEGWTPAERRERERILAALDECAGNQSRAAKVLGISRGTLVGRLDKYGLRRPRK